MMVLPLPALKHRSSEAHCSRKRWTLPTRCPGSFHCQAMPGLKTIIVLEKDFTTIMWFVGSCDKNGCELRPLRFPNLTGLLAVNGTSSSRCAVNMSEFASRSTHYGYRSWSLESHLDGISGSVPMGFQLRRRSSIDQLTDGPMKTPQEGMVNVSLVAWLWQAGTRPKQRSSPRR